MARIKRTEKQLELLKEYRREMKKANWRLGELEKLATKPEYENILNYAYRLAARDVKELGIGDINKVRYRIPTNTNKLESALRRVKAFNEMDTSLKSRIDALYRDNAINFNRAFGTNFTVSELKSFTDAVNWNELKRTKGSEVLLRAIKTVMKYRLKDKDIKLYSKSKGELLKKEIEDYTHLHKQVSTKDEVEIEIAKSLMESGLKYNQLYKGTGEFIKDSTNESPFID